MINIIFDFILNIDNYLLTIIQNYGVLVYLFLFFIIFLETGLVITPFLPGDSLIFVSGAFAGSDMLNIWALFFILISAAIMGDSANYFIGKFFGEKVFSRSRFFKKEYMEKTRTFYEKYGNKTIIIARFIPIIRTFAPFIAGIGKMDYKRFLTFNVIGGILWVSIFLFAGYYFGTIEFVKNNLSLVIFAIIAISIIPAIVEYLRQRRKLNK